MSAPIILRFYCKEHGYIESGFGTQITEVYFNQRGELGLPCPKCHKSRPMTIEQATGLDDNTGIRIFEGDIVELYDGSRYAVQYQLRWGGYELAGLLDRETLGDKVSDWDANVIGNIHQNEGLLG